MIGIVIQIVIQTLIRIFVQVFVGIVNELFIQFVDQFVDQIVKVIGIVILIIVIFVVIDVTRREMVIVRFQNISGRNEFLNREVLSDSGRAVGCAIFIAVAATIAISVNSLISVIRRDTSVAQFFWIMNRFDYCLVRVLQ